MEDSIGLILLIWTSKEFPVKESENGEMWHQRMYGQINSGPFACNCFAIEWIKSTWL